tara:strand:+ start:194 stop:385 length:192 start_codon:yes stop_codon:yes gene_type:complete
MKILIILATGAFITFPIDERVELNCFEQGHSIMQKISTYHGPGPNQGWYLKDGNVQVAGWYCE